MIRLENVPRGILQVIAILMPYVFSLILLAISIVFVSILWRSILKRDFEEEHILPKLKIWCFLHYLSFELPLAGYFCLGIWMWLMRKWPASLSSTLHNPFFSAAWRWGESLVSSGVEGYGFSVIFLSPPLIILSFVSFVLLLAWLFKLYQTRKVSTLYPYLCCLGIPFFATMEASWLLTEREKHLRLFFPFLYFLLLFSALSYIDLYFNLGLTGMF